MVGDHAQDPLAGSCARPPGPRGHWLLGNHAAYDADRIGFLRRAHAEFGDVFALDERTLFVIDPELTHDVLARTGREFLTELAPFEADHDLGAAAEQGRNWMSARRTAWPGLKASAAAAVDSRTVEILDDVISPGRELDALSTMYEFTARAIADYCFGPDATVVPGLLAASLTATAPFERASYQFPAWLPLPRHRRFFRVHRETRAALLELVRRRRAAAEAGSDLLGFLLTAAPEMPDMTVMSTLRGILMGGHGVPAAGLTSILRELALRPELVAELRAEAGESTVDARLPLAEAVVKEVMRLQPPVWLMTRIARTDTTLGPWTLRAGDELLLNPYLIHRDPRWWEEPDEFDPRRWLHGRAAPGNAYLPFGAGPRVCIGSVLTMRQLTLVTSHLAQRYVITSPNAATSKPAFLGRLAPAGLLIQFGTEHQHRDPIWTRLSEGAE